MCKGFNNKNTVVNSRVLISWKNAIVMKYNETFDLPII